MHKLELDDGTIVEAVPTRPIKLELDDGTSVEGLYSDAQGQTEAETPEDLKQPEEVPKEVPKEVVPDWPTADDVCV